MDEPRFLSGKLLLAMPGMADPRFERAVIALCVHDENGAVGVGIGHKRAGMRFRALLQQLDIDPGKAHDCAVHHGGPVEPDYSAVHDAWEVLVELCEEAGSLRAHFFSRHPEQEAWLTEKRPWLDPKLQLIGKPSRAPGSRAARPGRKGKAAHNSV